MPRTSSSTRTYYPIPSSSNHHLVRSQSVSAIHLPVPSSIHRSSPTTTTLKPLDINWDESIQGLNDYFPHTCIPCDLNTITLFELKINPRTNPLAYQLQQKLIESCKQSCSLCQHQST
jgi:hypothetical protein